MATTLVKGTAVVSLADGATLGTIDHVYLDPQRQEIVGFTVRHGGGLFGGETSGLVDVSDVHAFGADAVTVDDRSVVRSELAVDVRGDDLVDLEDLLKRKVITEDGTVVGQVASLIFGQDSYTLTAIEVSPGFFRDHQLIAGDQVRHIGAELIVVSDAVGAPGTPATTPRPTQPHRSRVTPTRDERRVAPAH